MRNYFILTGFLIGLMVSVVLVGREMVVAYENSIHLELEARLLEFKSSEIEMHKKAEEAKTVNLILAGDMMLSRSIGKKMEEMNDYTFPFLKIANVLRPMDLVFGNLEGPISSGGKNQGSIYSFRANPRVIEGLSLANFGILSLANNHIWDYGKMALLDTVNILNKNNISSVGAGRNNAEANEMVIKEIKGNKIGFLAYTDLYPESLEAGNNYPGISNFDLQEVFKKISEAKASSTADLIFVSLHWGDEYAGAAKKKQKEIAKELIDAGADVIIGHHPHVVQEFEEYKTSLIFYSLGNFIFDQNFSEETMSGYLVKIKIVNKKISDWEVVETKINKDFQVELGNLAGGQNGIN